MIESFNLTKIYRGGLTAVNAISFTINKRIVSIIGRNGAGKTTLLRMLSPQLKPTSGTATIDGLDILRDPERIRKHIVSIPQEASTLGVLTPLEHLKLFLIARGMSVSQATQESLIALRELEMLEAKDRPSDTLSGGMKRKVFVAMALAANADLTFLDEPTTGLDPVSRFEVWSAIKNLRGNIVLTTHYMEEAQELSQEVMLVDSGRILEHGNVRDLLKRFEGKVRAESFQKEEGDYSIGRTYVKYIDEEDAEKYIKMGYNIRRITLDDLFVARGVEIEP